MPSTPILTTLAYAPANSGSDMRLGKLLTSTSYNPELSSASVIETYTYAGKGGRVSARQTQVEGHVINQSFTWNDLGQIATLGYPDDSVLADPGRSISSTYTNGFLIAIPSYVTGITYHANGMVNHIGTRSVTLI